MSLHLHLVPSLASVAGVLVAAGILAAGEAPAIPKGGPAAPRPSGEPYELAGKRLAFTSWRYVRPGSFAWVDDKGKDVTVSGSQGPTEARLVRRDSPRGIRLAVQPASRGGRVFPAILNIAITTILKDGDLFKAWGTFSGDKGRWNVSIESADGQTWSPPMEEFTLDGKPVSTMNLGEGTVFLDPSAPASERFKLVTLGHFTFEEFEEFAKRNPERWEPRARREDAGYAFFVQGFVSPDGRAWTSLPEPLSVEHSDTQIVGYFDADLCKYVVYTRNWMVDPQSPLAKGGAPWHSVGRRSIGRTESEDFRRFPLSRIILVPPLDLPPSDVLYTNCRTSFPGAPREHLLFPTIWHTADDSTSVTVAASHDGSAWNSIPGGPVFGTAAFGQWDGGCVFARPNLLELPDGSFVLPYTGYDVPHKYPRGRFRFGTGYMVWPKGRLVGIVADEQGEFATIAFNCPGSRLLVNALTARGGRLLVAAADPGGAAVPGRSFDDCDPVIGDAYRVPVTWKGQDAIGVAKGTPLLLRFRLDRAKLFWVDFE
jgi:hypothetical protein